MNIPKVLRILLVAISIFFFRITISLASASSYPVEEDKPPEDTMVTI